jgi:G:T-mismatch repair DNA endonuclease (very short patch repair protein)
MPPKYKVKRLKRRPYEDAESESVSVWLCLWHKHHAASYHRNIPHSITSYIMSHQQQELSTRQTFGNYMMNESVLEHEANL